MPVKKKKKKVTNVGGKKYPGPVSKTTRNKAQSKQQAPNAPSKAKSNKKYNKKSNPSQTTSTYSNTNTVGKGKKGASGVMAIPTPKSTGRASWSKGGKPGRKPPARPGGRPPGAKPPGAKPTGKPKPMTGNPGNAKPVGRAGEKEDKGMWPGGGVRGAGDNKDKPKKKKKKK